jgi:hypothetical protein
MEMPESRNALRKVSPASIVLPLVRRFSPVPLVTDYSGSAHYAGLRRQHSVIRYFPLKIEVTT